MGSPSDSTMGRGSGLGELSVTNLDLDASAEICGGGAHRDGVVAVMHTEIHLAVVVAEGLGGDGKGDGGRLACLDLGAAVGPQLQAKKQMAELFRTLII